MRKIQILGTGCARCRELTANTEQALRTLGLPDKVEKVTEMLDIMAFEILMTPGLAIDGQVRVAGRVPSVAELTQLLQEGEALHG